VQRRLKKLGIPKEALLDSRGNVKSIIEVVKRLEESGATAGDILTIFGDRAGPAMAALIKRGSASLTEFKTKLDASGGTAKRVADVQMKGLTGAWRTFAAALEAVQIAITESGLGDLAVAIAKVAARALGFIATLDKKVLLIGTLFVLLAAAIGPVLLILGKFGVITAVVAKGVALKFAIIAGAITLVTGLVTGLINNWKDMLSWLGKTTVFKSLAGLLKGVLDKLGIFAGFRKFLGGVEEGKVDVGRSAALGATTLAGKPVDLTRPKKQEVGGKIDIAVKDKGEALGPIRASAFGGLDLGLSKVGI
jgi:hypothetical protein